MRTLEELMKERDRWKAHAELSTKQRDEESQKKEEARQALREVLPLLGSGHHHALNDFDGVGPHHPDCKPCKAKKIIHSALGGSLDVIQR